MNLLGRIHAIFNQFQSFPPGFKSMKELDISNFEASINPIETLVQSSRERLPSATGSLADNEQQFPSLPKKPDEQFPTLVKKMEGSIQKLWCNKQSSSPVALAAGDNNNSSAYALRVRTISGNATSKNNIRRKLRLLLTSLREIILPDNDISFLV